MFRQLTDHIWVSPQITPAHVSVAQAMGIGLIINNRPDDEEVSQPHGSDIAAAAAELGIIYASIAVRPGGFSPHQVKAMGDVLAEAAAQNRKVLAYCRTGTRSTFLWALALASEGASPEELSILAGRSGYDLASIGPTLNILSSQFHARHDQKPK